MGLEGLREHDKDVAPPSVATPRNGAAMALAGRAAYGSGRGGWDGEGSAGREKSGLCVRTRNSRIVRGKGFEHDP